MTRPEILDTAKKCVCGDREQDYGTPEQNFGTIAELWTSYKGIPLTAVDVAVFLSLVKIGRIASGHGKADNWIDLAGYAACGGEIESEQGKAHRPTQAELEDLFAVDEEPIKTDYSKWTDIELHVAICKKHGASKDGCESCPLFEPSHGWLNDNCTNFAGFREVAIKALEENT